VERESIMFNSKGVWENQKVSLNITQSGRYGYFTHNMLSFSLPYEDFIKPTEWHVERCKHLGFDFVALGEQA
jgi:hypothetical protein